jgi:hypothetical protein
VTPVRPVRAEEKLRPGAHLLKPLRQVIESINDVLKGQLHLEQHGRHTSTGVWVGILQRVLPAFRSPEFPDSPGRFSSERAGFSGGLSRRPCGGRRGVR